MTDPTPTRAEVARYTAAGYDPGMRASHEGAWVSFTDYQALRERAEAAEKANARWQRNSIETWQAMQAMRNDINEHMQMPSMESDLLQGPENGIFCASVSEAVITALTEARRAEAAALTTIELADQALEEAEAILGGEYGGLYGPFCAQMGELRHRIRALRRAAPTEGEA